jgi:ATP-dependent protease HslVU (ClpYQ) peptidase subunit
LDYLGRLKKQLLMTAVIGILNKEAVAVAADSAVTIGWQNGRKIYNTANKILAHVVFE